MNFSSDTAAPAHPLVLEAVMRANEGPEASYGADKITERLRATLAEVFETEDFDFWLTASGTASNALALSCFCPPTHSVICHELAHIHRDERGAVEFYTGGGRLQLLPGKGGKIEPDTLAEYLRTVDLNFVHGTPPAVLSLTNLTECGTLYEVAEVARLAGLAHAAGLTVHMDGARLANALFKTLASPANMTWRAGVDVLTLGLTKTGAMGCEIVLLFGKARGKAGELRARAKRSGHMPPKMRFLAAQAEAMLQNRLWTCLAGDANMMADSLARAFEFAEYRFAWKVQGNEVFVMLDEACIKNLQEAGARFYANWPGGSCRFVCSWATEDDEISTLRSLLREPPSHRERL